MSEPCPACWDLGWVLDGKKNGADGVALELMPCLYPPCEASGREVATFAVYQTFARLVMHPTTGRVMALADGSGSTWNYKDSTEATPTSTG